MIQDFANVIAFLGDTKNNKKVITKGLSIKHQNIKVPFTPRVMYIKNNHDNPKWFVEQTSKKLEIKGEEETSSPLQIEFNGKGIKNEEDIIKLIFSNKKIKNDFRFKDYKNSNFFVKEKTEINIFTKKTQLYVKEKSLHNILSPKINFKKYIIFIDGNKKDECGETENLIKGFQFVVQKGTYVELSLDFVTDESSIESVIALPSGLVFKNGKVRGTPLKSGEFTFYININDGSKIECNISIPKLVRLL